MRYRNISFATVSAVSDLLNRGVMLHVRGHHVRELRNRLTIIERPRERCLFVPHRGNNVIASLAETLWVLAGRNDTAWLDSYLPRAGDFSDDGSTWRAGYGPRLRNWNGVDQLAETRRLLLDERATRRAVMSLYDPDRDFVNSRDIPCNNWLSWLIRNDKLNLTIGVRSNDVMWGFSGVNSFEWSVLQELMAFWVAAEIGDVTYLATSFHLYERHDRRARRMVETFDGITCYDYGVVAPEIRIDFEHFDAVLSAWFDIEGEIRANPDVIPNEDPLLGDSFLSIALRLARIHHGVNRGWRAERVREELSQLPACDLTAGAYDLYSRRFPSVVDQIPNPQLSAFFAAYRIRRKMPMPGPAALVQAIKDLHARKDAAYGAAWKKRGELTSIVCNVARKVDRIEQYIATSAIPDDEPLFETVVDLFVYLTKYRLFLMESLPDNTTVRLTDRFKPISDDVRAFDLISDQYVEYQVPSCPVHTMLSEIVKKFEDLNTLATKERAPIPKRLSSVTDLAGLAFGVAAVLSDKDPRLLRGIAPNSVAVRQPSN
jgi:thymidylate synthase